MEESKWIKFVFTKDEWTILETAAKSQGYDNFRDWFRSMTNDLEKNLIVVGDGSCIGCTKSINRYQIQPNLMKKINILSDRYNIHSTTLIRYFTVDPILNARLNAHY
jgi:hypothetical protein